jgi:mRNA interferase HigB
MKVVGVGRLNDFKQRYTEAQAQLDAWLREANSASWRTNDDIKQRYVRASCFAGNRVVFEVAGDRYRLDVKINYTNQIVVIVRVGTCAEYASWSF